jgi:L-idonate 5-dehydrogenase
MRACVIHAKHDVRVEDVPGQPIGAGEVEVAITTGGICGSDLSYYNKGAVGDFVVREPMILGHEVVGRVTALGAGVDTTWMERRVAVNPSRPCGACRACDEDRSNLCTSMIFLGSAARFPHVQGGFRERLVVTAAQLVPIPDQLPDELAVFAEPLAVSLHGVQRSGGVAGKRVLIVGAGPIGALVTAVVAREGATSVVVTDMLDAPLATAQAVGATQTVNVSDVASAPEADVVFEASGSPAGLAAALTSVIRGGTVVQLGILPPGTVPVAGNLIVTKELDLHGSFRFAPEFSDAVALLADGLPVRPLLTGQFALEQSDEAFKLASRRDAAMKVQLVFPWS